MKKLLVLLCIGLVFESVTAQKKAQPTPPQAPPSVRNTPQSELNRFKSKSDSLDVNLRAARRPVIGLSGSQDGGSSYANGTYINAILKAGGVPLIIPVTTNGAALRAALEILDGLLLTGGEDVNPLWYEEEPAPGLGEIAPVRDEFDIKLVRMAADRCMPILGICRGEQLINVAFGGTLWQDIPSQRSPDNPVKHRQEMSSGYPSHTVTLADSSLIASLIGANRTTVNSHHHQAAKDVAPGFRATAYSLDSVIEAIEAQYYPILGVQWHPEGLVSNGDTVMLKIFRHLVGKAAVYSRAKELHRRIISVDTHSDTPLYFSRPGFNFADRERNRLNLPKMQEGMLDGAFLAAYIGQKGRTPDSLQIAVNRVTDIINEIHSVVAANADLCEIALTPADIARIKAQGKKAILIGIENGYGIGKDLANLQKYKDMGVLYITLCHSYDNDICDTSTHTKNEWDGLSPFGEEVVREMNRLGIIVDLSHVGESTFYDVMKLTRTPVICSHSASRLLCGHDRNLTDEQLQALAANGGVIQVCILDEYLNDDYKNASIDDLMTHIDHIISVAGIEHIGIGSDFDGGGGVKGCQSANEMLQITVRLLEKGYSDDDIAKIWGGNFLRVLQAVQDAAAEKP